MVVVLDRKGEPRGECTHFYNVCRYTLYKYLNMNKFLWPKDRAGEEVVV